MSLEQVEEKRYKHFLIRVADGKNFRNSVYPFWSVRKSMSSYVKKINKGDILWFITNKSAGGKVIGVAEFNHSHHTINDKAEKPLHLITSRDQTWTLDDKPCEIQLHYDNLYEVDNIDIKICIKGNRKPILYYETYQKNGVITEDFNVHYSNFKKYGKTKVFKVSF